MKAARMHGDGARPRPVVPLLTAVGASIVVAACAMQPGQSLDGAQIDQSMPVCASADVYDVAVMAELLPGSSSSCPGPTFTEHAAIRIPLDGHVLDFLGLGGETGPLPTVVPLGDCTWRVHWDDGTDYDYVDGVIAARDGRLDGDIEISHLSLTGLCRYRFRWART